MNLKGNKAAYTYSFIIPILCFSITNIIAAQGSSEVDMGKQYPLFVILIWTAVIGSLLYIGWKFAFIVNAVPLYAISIFAIWHHVSNESAQLEWLIGALPLPIRYLVFVPGIFLASLIIQFIINRLNREQEYIEEFE